MIRGKFQKDIIDTINEHKRFEVSDFKIETSKEKNTTLLSIYYLIENKYKISFNIPLSVSVNDNINYGRPYYQFSGKVCPGPLSFEENFNFIGENEVFSRITDWLDCVWEEITSNPVVKLIDEQQNQINEIFTQFDNIKDEYFTKEESIDLKNRLDSLEEKLRAEIEKNIKDKETLSQEISDLQIDIDTLKQTLNSFKKKGWFKTFTNKVFKWTKDSENRKLLKDGYSVVREFLPEEIKQSLPEEIKQSLPDTK